MGTAPFGHTGWKEFRLTVRSTFRTYRGSHLLPTDVPRTFHSGRIIGISPVSSPAAVLIGRPFHSRPDCSPRQRRHGLSAVGKQPPADAEPIDGRQLEVPNDDKQNFRSNDN